MSLENHYQQFLAENPYPRQLVNCENTLANSSAMVQIAGKNLINFSSSDYLGLSQHSLLIERSQEFAQKWGVGMGSSRLVSGNHPIYQILEESLAESLNKPAALILGTGYQTNWTVLQALLDKKILGEKPLVFCDKLCHSSIQLGIQHIAEVKRYRHNDLNHLKQLLEMHRQASAPKFILAESVYSMDGDCLDFKKIISLAKQYCAMLYIDDAHGVGIYGQQGWGQAAAYACDIDIVMGTFSKALGSYGGFIACSATMKDYLVNKCRGLIYSTALPAPILGAISAAIELVPQMTKARLRLMTYVDKVLKFFKENNLNCGMADSHIIPWIIGDAKKTLLASHLLKEKGILGVTIRPPSVLPRQCRIRFCLSALHEEEHIEKLLTSIKAIA